MNETERKIRLEQLDAEKTELMKQLQEINEKILSNSREQTKIRLYPFHEGEKAVCRLKDNKSIKSPFECVIEVEGGCVYVRPYKQDSTLSGRHFSVMLPESGSYAEYFTKAGGN